MRVIKLQPQDPGLTDLPDLELLVRIQNRGANEKEAQKAFNEFYYRYSKYLWKVCTYVCKNVPQGEELASDIFQTTFEKIYKNAPSIRKEGKTGVKALLGKIAQNEFNDHYNKYSKEILLEVNADWASDADDKINLDTIALESITAKKLEEVLDKLSEQEKHILFTYMQYFQPENPKGHLPDVEIERLCKIYNIKQDNLRQIKRRTLLKIKKLLI